jgi:hypothetical protein
MKSLYPFVEAIIDFQGCSPLDIPRLLPDAQPLPPILRGYRAPAEDRPGWRQHALRSTDSVEISFCTGYPADTV